MTLRLGSLCTGYGGLDMAVAQVLDVEPVWVADPDPGAAAILAHHMPEIPNLGDITEVVWQDVIAVDILAAGFPCQSVSVAGRRAGLVADAASGLWSHVAVAIAVLRPRLIVIENVGGLRSARADSDVEPCPWCLGDPDDEPHLRALGAVLGDLAALGFAAEWTSLRASDVGAPHQRERVFITAWPSDTDRPGVLRRAVAERDKPASDAQDERHEWGWLARGRWPRSSDGGVPSADAIGRELQRWGVAGVLDDSQRRTEGPRDQRERHGDAAGDRSAAPADPDGGGWRTEPGLLSGKRPAERVPADIAWGDYELAIRRWEHILGRPAPNPTEPGAGGKPRLSPRFVEWLMGLDEGHVTAVPGLTRNQQLKALGNGVVPQQGAAAIVYLVGRVALGRPEPEVAA